MRVSIPPSIKSLQHSRLGAGSSLVAKEGSHVAVSQQAMSSTTDVTDSGNGATVVAGFWHQVAHFPDGEAVACVPDSRDAEGQHLVVSWTYRELGDRVHTVPNLHLDCAPARALSLSLSRARALSLS